MKDSTDNSSIVKQSGSYVSEGSQYYGFDVQFDRPVCLQENKKYKLVSLIKGPNSWYGEDGQVSVECEGVRFTFTSSDASSNNTSETRGQFPALIGASSEYPTTPALLKSTVTVVRSLQSASKY